MSVELRRHLDLARQAAVWQALRGGAVQQFILVDAHRFEFCEPGLVHIDVTSGTSGAAAVFGDDATRPFATAARIALLPISAPTFSVRLSEWVNWMIGIVTL